MVLAALSAGCAEEPPAGSVHLLTLDGPVDHVFVRYLERGIEHAEDAGATAVVVRIDTPGGSIDAMRDAVGLLDDARVPVLTWVGPAGARAASAGTFVAMAGDIAAMAPGTTIGAATPVTAGGADVPGALGRKVESDAAAFAREVAQLHGRNVEWADLAVREAVSAGSGEAVELHVVDFAAKDLDELLQRAAGREVGLGNGDRVVLDFDGVPIVGRSLNVYEHALRFISHPLVVGLLFFLGVAFVAAELHAPGLLLPGTLGVFLLIAALVGLGTLVPQQAAIAVAGLGVLLVLLELLVPGGVLGAIGALAILVGLGALLADSTAFDLRFILTIVAIVVTVIGLVVGLGLAALARRYIAPTERTGTARL